MSFPLVWCANRHPRYQTTPVLSFLYSLLKPILPFGLSVHCCRPRSPAHRVYRRGIFTEQNPSKIIVHDIMNHKITLPLLIITKIPRYDMHLHQRRAKPFKSNYARSTLGGLRRPTVGAPLSQQKAQLFMSPIEKSSKLDNVCYDIRGPVLKEAKRLEEEGNKVLKLNIGNPCPVRFRRPGRNPGRRDPQSAHGARLLRLQRPLLGA